MKFDFCELKNFALNSNKRSKKSILEPQRKVINGVTFVVETLSFFPSVTAGIWLKGGSRTENAKVNGVSHFIEHLLFKGSKEVTYSQIYKAFDRMGGAVDAFTSREIMGFYFRVQRKNFEEAFYLLCEMLFNPAFNEEEIERERGVILEEIKMVNDTPSDVAVDIFMNKAYKGNSLGLPIQGSLKSVKGIKRRDILLRHKELISPSNIIVTATGEIDLKEVERNFSNYFKKLIQSNSPPIEKATFYPGIFGIEKKHLEQTQIVMGFQSEKSSSPKRYALMVLANILGGTMSSRLFTEIREKLGLVYSISADHIGEIETGIFGISAASSNENSRRTIDEIVRVLEEFCKNGPSKEEIEIAKENIIGATLLSLESGSARMGRLARNEVYFGKQKPIEDSIKGVDMVKGDEILKIARETFNPKRMNMVVLGNKRAVKGIDFSQLERRW